MSASVPLRVMVTDVWDEAELAVDPRTSVGDLKQQVLRSLRVRRDPGGYVMKYRGAALLNEAGSLEDAGIVPNANLIILPRRRRPVR